MVPAEPKEVPVTSDAAAIRAASHVLLPGVGAARDAMDRLAAAGLDEVIRSLTQPVLGVNPHDDLWEITPRAREHLSAPSWLDLPDLGFGLFDAATDLLAEAISNFLNGSGE